MGVLPEGIHVIPNAIALDEFDRAAAAPTTFEAPAGRIVVAGVARHVPQKRLDRFLRSIAEARAADPRILGVLVGDGPDRVALETLARTLGLLPDGVAFLGSRPDVPSVLRQVHILLMTADHEGFPNAALEAMAAGLPIVTTPAGEMPSIVSDGVNGYVADFNDIDGMAERLARLARDGALRERMGAAGRRLVEEQYNFDGLGARLLESYRCLRRGRHSVG